LVRNVKPVSHYASYSETKGTSFFKPKVIKLISLILILTASPPIILNAETVGTISPDIPQTDAQMIKQVTLKTIINRLDTLYRSDTAYAEMKMTIQTPHWERTLSMKSWSEGLDKTFIVIESPRREKGISTLRKGNEMWNFFPKINKVMKIPPHQSQRRCQGGQSR